MIQKVETWRIKELEIILNQISGLLRKGNNNDWANVIAHFHHESHQILSKKEFDLNALKRLILNIRNCYEDVNSFKNLSLWQEDSELNQEFHCARSRLFSILVEMENQIVEYVN